MLGKTTKKATNTVMLVQYSTTSRLRSPGSTRQQLLQQPAKTTDIECPATARQVAWHLSLLILSVPTIQQSNFHTYIYGLNIAKIFFCSVCYVAISIQHCRKPVDPASCNAG